MSSKQTKSVQNEQSTKPLLKSKEKSSSTTPPSTPTETTSNTPTSTKPIKHNKHDISRAALREEFTDKPMFYCLVAVGFLFLCYIISSFVLYPILFKNRSTLHDTDFHELSTPTQQQQPSTTKFFKTTSDALPSIIPTHDSNAHIELPPELQRTRKFAPLSNTLHTLHTPDVNNNRLTTDLINELIPTRISLLPLLLQSYPHNSACFTQGYTFFEGELYESCGMYKESSLQTVNYTNGVTIRHGPAIPSNHFAEGLAISGSGDNAILYLLTWKEKIIHRYRPHTWEQLPSLKIPTEGWGIAIDPKNTQLVVSDGSAYITWYHPETMKQLRRLLIREWDTKTQKFKSIGSINELEWVGGEIWANVWFQNDIIVIDPNSGQVTRRLDSTGIHPNKAYPEDVLNGIAYGENENGETKLLVTGKYWKQTFELDWTQLVIQGPDESTPMPELPKQ